MVRRSILLPNPLRARAHAPPQKSYCYFMCVGEFGIARGADAHLAVKPRAMRNRLSALNLQVLTAAQRPTTTRTLRSSSRRAWLAGVGIAGACARTRAFLGRAFEPHSAGGVAPCGALRLLRGVVWRIAFVCYDGMCDLMNLNCDGRGAWLLGVGGFGTLRAATAGTCCGGAV